MPPDISPPPTKRRRISECHSPSALATARHGTPPPNHNPDTMRLFSWNINGISPFLQRPITSFFAKVSTKPLEDATQTASLREFLQRHHWPQILFLQEVKIARSDNKTQDAVRAAVNAPIAAEALSKKDQGPKYNVHFTLANDPQNARGPRGSGKVYGVCSIIRSDFASSSKAQHRTVDWDNEGRVSVIELTQPHKLALFNIYAVNGTDNPYRDPMSGAVRGTRHDRKLAFHRLLMEECLGLESKGWKVLLAGDFNVAPNSRDGYPKLRTFPHQHTLNRADFNKKFFSQDMDEGKGLRAVDVWRQMHGVERRYTYYSRGRIWGSSCDRVDYVIAGSSVWEDGLVRSAGILDSEVERGPSDHVPVWVEVRIGGTEATEGGNDALGYVKRCITTTRRPSARPSSTTVVDD